MSNHLSKVGKLDGIPSWSLPAIDTCPGRFDKDGNVCNACQGCYATIGRYNCGNVKKARGENKQAWKSTAWIQEMVNAVKNEQYFRWFDSGDMYHTDLGRKMYRIMELTPWVNYWVPTRMMKFKEFKPILNKMDKLDNVKVRFSSDSINGEFVQGIHGSVIIPNTSAKIEGIFACPATKNGGKCNGCRECWNKDTDTIGYFAHGYKMKKLLGDQFNNSVRKVV